MALVVWRPSDGVPGFELDQLIDLMKTLSPGAYTDLCYSLKEDDRKTVEQIVEWLKIYDGVLFRALEDILKIWQNAHDQCQESTSIIANAHIRYRTLRYIYQKDDDEELAEKIEKKKKEKKKKKPAKTTKRKMDEEEEVNLKDNLDMLQDLERTSINSSSSWSSSFHVIDSKFNINAYKHYVPKGQKPEDLKKTKWEVVYDTSGPWAAEKKVEELAARGEKGVVVKKKRCGADSEVLAYKVLSYKVKDKEKPKML